MVMPAGKARKVAGGYRNWWQKWRHQRHKYNAFLIFVDNGMTIANNRIKKCSKSGELETKFKLDKGDSYDLWNSVLGGRDALKLDSDTLEDVLDTGIIAICNKLRDKGYITHFDKGWDEKEDYYYELRINWK